MVGDNGNDVPNAINCQQSATQQNAKLARPREQFIPIDHHAGKRTRPATRQDDMLVAVPMRSPKQFGGARRSHRYKTPVGRMHACINAAHGLDE
ncbi:MAG: hypothetical protein ACR2PA_10855 [Hyphomicrobiaceae bacterium]